MDDPTSPEKRHIHPAFDQDSRGISIRSGSPNWITFESQIENTSSWRAESTHGKLIAWGWWFWDSGPFHNNPFYKGMPGIQTTNFPLKDSNSCENYVSKWESSPSKGATATQDAETYTKSSRKINSVWITHVSNQTSPMCFCRIFSEGSCLWYIYHPTSNSIPKYPETQTVLSSAFRVIKKTIEKKRWRLPSWEMKGQGEYTYVLLSSSSGNSQISLDSSSHSRCAASHGSLSLPLATLPPGTSKEALQRGWDQC